MNETDILGPIKPVLEAWSAEATRVLAEENLIVSVTLSSDRWRQVHGDLFLRSPAPTWFLEAGAQERLASLASYGALEAAVRESPVLAPMLGGQVGSPRVRYPFDIWNIAEAFIPDLREEMPIDAYSFEQRYQEVVEVLAARELEYKIVCPIIGADFEVDRVVLDTDLVIERLSAAEIANALNFNLLAPLFAGSSGFSMGDAGGGFGLKRFVRLPVIVARSGAAPEDLVSDEVLTRANGSDEVDEFQQCIALMTPERISISGWMSMLRSTNHLVIDESVSYAQVEPIRCRRPQGPYHFSSAECAELQRLWALTHQTSFAANKAIALALRRLAFASHRTRPEDRLLDCFIAAEAFYLTDAGDVRERGDLRYRLALRAAVWSVGTLPEWSKRDVFRQMRKGYDVRSAFAHGGSPRAADLVVKGARVELPEFSVAVEEIVRKGVYKALTHVTSAGRVDIQWEELLLPEEEAEPSDQVSEE
jgi:hypothetical protein